MLPLSKRRRSRRTPNGGLGVSCRMANADDAMALITEWMKNKTKVSLFVTPSDPKDPGAVEAQCTISSVTGVHFTYQIVTVTTGGYGLGDAQDLVVDEESQDITFVHKELTVQLFGPNPD